MHQPIPAGMSRARESEALPEGRRTAPPPKKPCQPPQPPQPPAAPPPAALPPGLIDALDFRALAEAELVAALREQAGAASTACVAAAEAAAAEGTAAALAARLAELDARAAPPEGASESGAAAARAGFVLQDEHQLALPPPPAPPPPPPPPPPPAPAPAPPPAPPEDEAGFESDSETPRGLSGMLSASAVWYAADATGPVARNASRWHRYCQVCVDLSIINGNLPASCVHNPQPY